LSAWGAITAEAADRWTLALLGVSLASGVPLLALAAGGFIVIVATVHVPHEEARMHAQFGRRFDLYCASTRRWL
jgi:protein-S-isoprenylcysteine O-methyltransferase Ste14